MSPRTWYEGRIPQSAVLMGVSTAVLTAGFVGLLAIISGEARGIGNRVPVYALVMAIGFVATIVVLIRYEADGGTVLAAASGVGVIAFVVGLLAGEGIAYAVRAPGEVFGSQLLLYFLAAGLICTGLSWWTVNYWRDFARAHDVGEHGVTGRE